MENLRTKLIRVAKENPHLRSDLLPLLIRSAGDKGNGSRQNPWTSGTHEVLDGTRYAEGNAVVYAYGKSVVIASGNAEVRANDNVVVYANDNAMIYAYDNATVETRSNYRGKFVDRRN